MIVFIFGSYGQVLSLNIFVRPVGAKCVAELLKLFRAILKKVIIWQFI